MACAWLDNEDFPKTAKVIHLTRHPLEVYRSLYFKDSKVAAAYTARSFVQGVLGAELPPRRREYFVEFIRQWNERIEHSGLVYDRVDVRRVRKFMESERRQSFIEPTERVRPHAGRRAPKLGWNDMPKFEGTDALHAMAVRYGYE